MQIQCVNAVHIKEKEFVADLAIHTDGLCLVVRGVQFVGGELSSTFGVHLPPGLEIPDMWDQMAFGAQAWKSLVSAAEIAAVVAEHVQMMAAMGPGVN